MPRGGAPTLAFVTGLLNAVGVHFLVMVLSRSKVSIVVPTASALALVVVVSRLIYQQLPSVYGAGGIALASAGSMLLVYSDEKCGEATADEQTRI